MTATSPAAALGTADAAVFLNARCVGLHDLHDPRGEHESPAALRVRHTAALGVCRGCPCTTSCADLLDTLPLLARGGVWSGRSVELPGLTIHLSTAGVA